MFNEEKLENMTTDMLEGLGYECLRGEDVSREETSILLENELFDSIVKLNPWIGKSTVQEVIRKIKNLGHNNTVLNNKEFTRYLLDGISVPVDVNGETRYKTVKIVDFDDISNNNFKAIRQLIIVEHGRKIPDVILFVNGLPLVVIELKSSVREEVQLKEAFNQLKGYQEVHIPSLFYYNQFLVVSDGVTAKAGTITSNWTWFLSWKKIEATDKVMEEMPTHETLIYGMLRKERILDIINNYIFWSEENKILSAYHQYFGVKKAIASTEQAMKEKTGKAGIIWHTQGSGKSFSMVFYAGNMIKKLSNPSIVVITDRNDLDNQLFATFVKSAEYLKQQPVQIESRLDLNEKLDGRKSGGIFFSTLQKFEEETGLFSARDDILVIVDEAHRSHFGVQAKILLDTEKKEAYKKYGTGKYLREAFPNATYIGFTGTPVETRDKSTRNIFGDIIDVYDMTQSIMDGSTVPITYQSRMAKVGLNQKILNDIDKYYEKLQFDEGVEEYKIQESQKATAKMKKIIESPDRLEMIVKDIIQHYEEIENSVANKVMVVAYSRKAAYEMYKKFLKLRPGWKDKINMVITPSNQDDLEMQKAIGTSNDKKIREKEFKDVGSKFKIAIVVDMWLTGFDVPSLGTMYIDKPMKSHNLMQAISRVNRVYKDKKGGLIVDYIGLKRWLLDALKTYTKRDKNKVVEIDKLVIALKDKVELIRDLFFGFKYKNFVKISDKDKYELIKSGADWICQTAQRKEEFMQYSGDIKNLYALCAGALERSLKDEILFYIAVRSFITKLSGGKIDVNEINKKVGQMLEKAIQDDEMIQIGEMQNSYQLSIFSTTILNKLAKMKERNIAAEMLTKALKGYIKQIGKQNIVMMEKFSEKFQKIVTKYNERVSKVDLEKIILEMINLTNEIRRDVELGNEYGLSVEERAFFDALGNDPEVKELMKDKVLVEIAKELVDTINNNTPIDWHVRRDARAKMRMEIKKLLKKYNYPPNKRKEALETVIKQAELKCKNMFE